MQVNTILTCLYQVQTYTTQFRLSLHSMSRPVPQAKLGTTIVLRYIALSVIVVYRDQYFRLAYRYTTCLPIGCVCIITHLPNKRSKKLPRPNCNKMQTETVSSKAREAHRMQPEPKLCGTLLLTFDRLDVRGRQTSIYCISQ